MIDTQAGDRLVWDVADLDPSDVLRFGGKGAGLARMQRAGISVPPAFVIGTDGFRAFHAADATLPSTLTRELDVALERLQARTGKRFAGAGAEPLLVSVRSGAAVSMPGMMDTVLNLGLDARAAEAFARVMADVPFAVDTWLRFWRMFGDIVLGIETSELGRATAHARAELLAEPAPRNFEALERDVVAWFAAQGAEAETRPREQLRLAVAAVFASWNSRRAKAYRKNQAISDDLGTAVTVQAMVFGNRDLRSGSGVAFSCNPNTGERGLFGEYVVGRQGEDLVAGTATPVQLSAPDAMDGDLRRALADDARRLERLYRDAVDIEFTVEAGRLYLLQVRAAKRTAEAAVRVAAELLREGTIDAPEALRRVTPEQLGKLLRPTFDPAAVASATVLTSGIASSPGHACGVAVLDSDDAAERAGAGERVILLRPTTSPQDIRGMLAAEGIVTARGGALSHAAVVSRALDKPCIVGCAAIEIDLAARTFAVAGRRYPEGTALSLDGESGTVYLGSIPLAVAAAGVSELAELTSAARALAGVELSLAALDFTDVQRANERSEPVIAGLTDLLIAAGTIDRLTTAIGRLVDAQTRDAAAFEIEGLARSVASRALSAAPHGRVAFRLPSFLSERARQIVPAWAALPPESLLPLGDEQFYVSLVRGIAAAARAAGVESAHVLLSGVTDVSEMAVFRRDLGDPASPSVGALIRSFAGLQSFSASAQRAYDVWLDVDAIVQSVYGFPSELFSSPGVFARYRDRGCLATDPHATLAPFLANPCAELVRGSGVERAGVIVGAMALDGVALALYDAGFRRFAIAAGARERMLLAFGRHAAGVSYE